MKDTKKIPVVEDQEESYEDDYDDESFEDDWDDDWDDDPWEDDCPCDDCPNKDYCDGWEAQFCCTLCHWHGNEHCDDCDPMDI